MNHVDHPFVFGPSKDRARERTIAGRGVRHGHQPLEVHTRQIREHRRVCRGVHRPDLAVGGHDDQVPAEHPGAIDVQRPAHQPVSRARQVDPRVDHRAAIGAHAHDLPVHAVADKELARVETAEPARAHRRDLDLIGHARERRELRVRAVGRHRLQRIRRPARVVHRRDDVSAGLVKVNADWRGKIRGDRYKSDRARAAIVARVAPVLHAVPVPVCRLFQDVRQAVAVAVEVHIVVDAVPVGVRRA